MDNLGPLSSLQLSGLFSYCLSFAAAEHVHVRNKVCYPTELWSFGVAREGTLAYRPTAHAWFEASRWETTERRKSRTKSEGLLLVYFYIGIGGALGSIARYAVSASIAKSLAEVFPWGTLIVNISGCLLIGIFATLTGPDGRILVPPDFRQFFMVGICGGYTTFSSFSLQTLALARDGDITRATLNVVASVLLCLVGVWLGSSLGNAINQIKGA